MSADIMDLIATKDEWTVGALIELYSLQTTDEQALQGTIHQNAIGFNALDADVLSSISEFYNRTGFLTSKQLGFVRRTIKKYHRQIRSLDIAPAQLKEATKKEKPKAVMETKLDGKTILIYFSFPKGDNRFREVLNKVKSLEGRKWNPDLEGKPWTAPLALDNVEDLIGWGFDIAPEIKEWYDKMSEEKPVDLKGLPEDLFPFQREGVAFIETHDGRAMIGDEMGLGKTAQALSWINYKKAFPAVITVPASLKLNWERECGMWCPEVSVEVLSGTKADHDLKQEITIVNYDILKAWAGKIQKVKPKCLVFDEAHYLKNSRAQRTKTARALIKGVPHILTLTGTPIINRPVEFFTALNMIAPERFSSFWNYAKRFCNPKHNGFGWDFTGSSNTEELHAKACKVMIRRKKKDVLKDLPPKIRTVVPLEINNRPEYNRAVTNFKEWLKEKKEEQGKEEATNLSGGAEILTQIEYLKQITAKGKMESILQWILDYISSDNKLVVFATHHKVIDSLMAFFKKEGIGAVKLDGRSNQKDKQTAIDAFQILDSIRVFVGNIKAAGVGITLTASSATAFIELGWTPGEHDQAEDRVHRIGQEADSVNAYYLIGADTIDEDIAELIDKKRAVLSEVLDGEKVAETALLTALLERLDKEG